MAAGRHIGDESEVIGVLGHTGACQATGVVVISRFSSAVELVRAETTLGTWRHESGLVSFQLGRMTSASTNLIKIGVRPQQGGLLTNDVEILVNEAEGKGDNTRSIGTVVEGSALPKLSVVSIGAGQFAVQLTGQTGRSYRLQASSDLVTWQDLASTSSGNLTLPLPDQSDANARQRFYRAVSP